MSLDSLQYVGFLLGIFLLYYALSPGRPRRFLLLAASYFFYFELSHLFVVVLLAVTAVAYFGAFLLRSKLAAARGSWLFFLVCTLVLAPLLIVKYLGIVLGAMGIDALFNSVGNSLAGIALPVGVSFFTFAALGYVIDVYLEVADPEPDFSRVALFVAFFPLISAGPIERAGGLMPQLDCDRRFTSERALSALRTILIGLVMKNLMSETLAEPANAIFANPSAYAPFERFCGAFFYAFYIYADFAGYSLVAIGSAKLFGFDVRPNFHQPFLSTTMQEFWRNWHISLSSWVRDYVFVPLRTEWRRQKEIGMVAALLISFLIVGVWHGARWGFVAYGAFHGLLVAGSTLTLQRRNAFLVSLRVPQVAVDLWRTVFTFLLVVLCFVVYRANSMHDAMEIYAGIFSAEFLHGMRDAVCFYVLRRGVPPFHGIHGFACWAMVATMIAGDILVRRKITVEKFPVWLQVSACNIALLLVLLNWLVGHVNQPFHYYQF